MLSVTKNDWNRGNLEGNYFQWEVRRKTIHNNEGPFVQAVPAPEKGWKKKWKILLSSEWCRRIFQVFYFFFFLKSMISYKHIKIYNKPNFYGPNLCSINLITMEEETLANAIQTPPILFIFTEMFFCCLVWVLFRERNIETSELSMIGWESVFDGWIWGKIGRKAEVPHKHTLDGWTIVGMSLSGSSQLFAGPKFKLGLHSLLIC